MSTMLALSAETLAPPRPAAARISASGDKTVPLSLLRILVGTLLIGVTGFAIFTTPEPGISCWVAATAASMTAAPAWRGRWARAS